MQKTRAIFWLFLFLSHSFAFAGNGSPSHQSLGELHREEFSQIAKHLTPTDLNSLTQVNRSLYRLVRKNPYESLQKKSFGFDFGWGPEPVIVKSYSFYEFLKTQGWWTGLQEIDFSPSDPNDCLPFMSDIRAKTEIESLTLHASCLSPEALDQLKTWQQLSRLFLNYDENRDPTISRLLNHTPWDLSALEGVLGELIHLEVFEIRKELGVSVEGGKWLDALARLPKLRHVGIRNVSLGYFEGYSFHKAVESLAFEGTPDFLLGYLNQQEQKHPKFIEFKGGFSDPEEEKLADVLRLQKDLEGLDLNVGQLGGGAGHHLLNAAAELHSLRAFSYQSDGFIGVGTLLARVIRSNPLTQLRIVNALQRGDEFGAVVPSLENLKDLKDLDFSRELQGQSVSIHLSRLMRKLSKAGAELKSLRIHGYLLESVPLEKVGKGLNQLKILDLSQSGSSIRREALAALSILLSPSVLHLNLNGFHFAPDPYGMIPGFGWADLPKTLFEVVAKGAPNLASLEVGGNVCTEQLAQFGRRRARGQGTGDGTKPAEFTALNRLETLEWKRGFHANEPKVHDWSKQFPSLKRARLTGFGGDLVNLAKQINPHLLHFELEMERSQYLVSFDDFRQELRNLKKSILVLQLKRGSPW